MESCFLGNERLRVECLAQGAELRSVRLDSGQELLWSGDPAVWGRVSPVLFPVVGRLKDDLLHHGGQSYAMAQHGFARDRTFRLLESSRERCLWSLEDDAESRAQFPFPFELRIAYALNGAALDVTYELRNPGPGPLPASLGAHPAFRWPLGEGPREGHWLHFAQPEPAPVRRLREGLLAPELHPTPVEGATLSLRDELFEADALIFPDLQSREVFYGAPEGISLRFHWEGFPHFGLWSKPGAGFLCLEPWHGFASPWDFAGDFLQKPGVMVLNPGETRSFRWGIEVMAAPER